MFVAITTAAAAAFALSYTADVECGLSPLTVRDAALALAAVVAAMMVLKMLFRRRRGDL